MSKDKLKAGQMVAYDAGISKVRARVITVHKDKTVSVLALFFMRPDGTDASGYLGFKYRMHASDLQALPRSQAEG